MQKPIEKPQDSLSYCLKKYYWYFEAVGSDKHKDYLVCFYTRQQILDEDNNVDKTKLKAYFSTIRSPAYVNVDLVDKCAVKQESTKETAYYLYQCLSKVLTATANL